jgi:hypothetical protein
VAAGLIGPHAAHAAPAPTGGTFILGQSNDADATTALTATPGTGPNPILDVVQPNFGYAIFGRETSGHLGSAGLFGTSDKSTSAPGSGDGPAIGVSGLSGSGIGVKGDSTSGAGVVGFGSITGDGVRGFAHDATAYAVRGINAVGTAILGDATNGGSGSGSGVYGQSDHGDGVIGATASGTGVRGGSTTGDGVIGVTGAASAYGVHGVTQDPNGTAIFGDALLPSGSAGTGVAGVSDKGSGLQGTANGAATAMGVVGQSSSGYGLVGLSTTGVDLAAHGTGRFLQTNTLAHAGPPTASDGSFAAGEQIRDAAWALWLCTAGGAPGTWVPVAVTQPGYLGGGLNLLPIPIRLLDTRAGAPVGNDRPGVPIAYHGTLNVPAAGVTYQGQTIPSGATAVFGLLTAALAPGVNCGDGSSAIAYAAGATRPAAVNVVFNPGDLHGAYTSDFALVRTGASGDFSLYNQPINSVAVDYIFDCFGFVM